MPNAGQAVGPVGAAGPPGRPQQQQGGSSMLFTVIRMAMFWYFINNMFGKKAPKDPALVMHNMFSRGEDLDMWVYITDSESFSSFSDESSLVWSETNIPYGIHGPKGERALAYTYHPSENAQRNGSVFAHIFFARTGFSPDPSDPSYDRSSTFHKSQSLVAFYPRPKVDRRKNLLGKSLTEEGAAAEAAEEAARLVEGDEPPKAVPPQAVAVNDDDDDEDERGDDSGEEEPPREWISFWKPNCTITLVDDFNQYTRGQVPEQLRPHMAFDLESGNYFPTVYVNEFWLLRDKLTPLNETVEVVPLALTLSTLSMWKWQLYISMEQSFKLQASYGTMVDGEGDEIKRVFLEGNPVLLGITMAVSLLHSVFDFLAFKNDIQFWNANKSMEGLSARTVVINFFCQLVIFLYLLDNDTSWMILISSGIGCCIEFWKIGKAMHVEVDRSGLIPRLRFKDRESYANNKTKEYDELASKYLSYSLYPLVGGYAIYSLVYQTHKSWYSWILSSLTGCVYTFGFIMMCPQLFINYKLKSVAHLPWRQMTYKFLNTIIDDLFAFVIKMPLLHRLSVFRDDIVFCIFLYQRYIYPVDKTRINEFGFGGPEAQGAGGPTIGGAGEGTLALDDGTAGASTSSQMGISEGSMVHRPAGGSSANSSDAPATDAAASSSKKDTPVEDKKKL
eukprot:jgi/Mesen1/9271/ME000060S08709